MSLLVGMPIDWPRIGVIAFGRNRIGGFLRINILPDCFRSIRLIAKDVAPCDFYLPEQGDSMYRVVVIAGAEQKSQRIAKAIHQSMDFRISAASGYTNCLIF